MKKKVALGSWCTILDKGKWLQRKAYEVFPLIKEWNVEELDLGNTYTNLVANKNSQIIKEIRDIEFFKLEILILFGN